MGYSPNFCPYYNGSVVPYAMWTSPAAGMAWNIPGHTAAHQAAAQYWRPSYASTTYVPPMIRTYPGYRFPSLPSARLGPVTSKMPQKSMEKPVALEVHRLTQTEKIRKSLKYDVLRNTPLRYLGYANELVESWDDVIRHHLKQAFGNQGKPLGDQIYKWSYRLSALHLGLDALDKACKSYLIADDQPTHKRILNSVIEASGAGLFQGFSSYLLPPLAVKYSRKLITHLISLIPTTARYFPKNGLMCLWLPALLSTVMTPFIAHPIDLVVHKAMEYTYWPLVAKIFKRPLSMRLIDEDHLPHYKDEGTEKECVKAGLMWA